MLDITNSKRFAIRNCLQNAFRLYLGADKQNRFFLRNHHDIEMCYITAIILVSRNSVLCKYQNNPADCSGRLQHNQIDFP